jgi:nitrate/nitrite transport system ATP-binding protein
MALLELRNVSKSFSGGASAPVLHKVNLDLEAGELLAILGLSGSGKSTLISLIAGLLGPDSGTIVFAGKEVTEPGPERGVVFQNYSLLPWLTVHENVRLAVEQAFPHWPRRKQREKADEHVELVRLAHAREKRPAQLSGGMRQRVSLARALALDPQLLLLDEPLGALDALTRASLQDEIVRIWSRDRKSMILITNDVDEAILLADRIALLTPGPMATMGPSFPVGIDRPRDRRSLNSLAKFKELREMIIRYLVSARRSKPDSQPVKPAALPEAEAVDLLTPYPASSHAVPAET